VNEFTVVRVRPNVAADISVPANEQTATIPPATIATTKIADGVWFLGGGSHHSPDSGKIRLAVRRSGRRG